MEKEIRICPKCKSENVILVTELARGVPEFNRGECKDCGYTGVIPILRKGKK
jgi:hypothetical protein